MNNLKNNKRGLSAVITTVIMIALVLVAVGIVWAVVNTLIQDQTEKIEAGAVMINLDLKSATISEDNTTTFITVKRGVGKGDLSKIKFLLSDGNEEIVKEVNTTLRESEIKKFNFSLNDLSGNLVKISIVPIIVLESGEEFTKDVSDEISVNEFTEEVETPSEPVCSDGICNGDETCTSCSSDCGICGEVYPNFCPDWIPANCQSNMCGWFEDPVGNGEIFPMDHVACIGDSPDDDPEDYLGAGYCAPTGDDGFYLFNGREAGGGYYCCDGNYLEEVNSCP
jgi:flagellin-like protein